MARHKKWTGKSRGNKTGHQIFVFLLRHLGIRAAYSLLVFVALYFFVTKWKTNSYIYQYFRKYGYGKVKCILKVYKNYFIFGQSLLDRVAVMAGLNKKFSFDFDGEHHIVDMINAQKGGILLSAHSGNWEIAGHFLDRLEVPIHILMVDAEYQKVKEYLENVTGKRKANIIAIKEDQSHLYQIIEALGKKELICIHADRLLSSTQKTIRIPFLNEEASFPYSVFKMIVTLEVPVTFVFAYKEKGLHYHFFASPAQEYKGADKEENINKLANGFVSELEQKLRMYPLQWFNYFNFWEKNTTC